MNKQTNILYRKNNETKEKINARSNQRNEGEQRKKKRFRSKKTATHWKTTFIHFHMPCVSRAFCHILRVLIRMNKKNYI